MNHLPPDSYSTHHASGNAALPDYYAEERQAQARVRVQRVVKLVGLALGMAALIGAIGIWESRP
jgi:hypothetical protein